MNRTHSVVVCALVAVGCSSGSSTTGAAATSGASSASASGSSAAAAASPSASGSAATSAALSSAALGKLTVGADSLFSDEGAVVEGFDEGSAAFAFASDGPVKVAIADVDGKPVSAPDRKASLTYTIPETGKTIEVPLKSDADKHYLVASGPELSSVVTPVKYEISGGPRPWTGILQLPAGGTKALNASAQAAAAAHAAPVVGPHGGRIERIGKDDVELLIDKDSGETRAWIIVDGKAVDPGARNFTVVIDDKPLKLKADANLSFYGKVSADMGLHLGEVHKLTGELTEGPGDHPSLLGTVLFGLRPHVYVYAPRVIVDVDVDGWTKEKRAKWDTHPDDDDDQGRDHDHHDNGKHEGSEDHGDHGKHGDDHGDHDHGDHDHADHGDHAHADHVDHDHGDHGDDHAKPAPNGAAHGSSGKKKGRD